MSNKIKFGLKNVHYATFTYDDSTGYTYGTPVKLKGAVELSLEPRGDMIEFYADDMLYYSASNNQGYDGTLTAAIITDEFAKDILGEQDDENGVLIQSTTDKGSPFALLFEFDGDEKATRHILYNCTASRPTVESETKDDAPEPNTDELTFVASAREDDYAVKAKTTKDTDSTEYDDWYTSVYEPNFNGEEG